MTEIAVLHKVITTQGKKAKLNILKENESVRVNELLVLAFNPFLVFGLKRLDYVKSAIIKYDDKAHDKFVKLCIYCTKHNIARVKRDKVVAFLNTQELPQQRLYYAILIKKLCLGIIEKDINTIFTNLIPRFTLMLAAAKEDANFKNPMIVQEKLAGVRCVIIKRYGKCSAFIRSGKPVILPNIFRELQRVKGFDNYVIDGELFFNSRTETTAIITKLLKGNKKITDEKLTFFIFDYLEYSKFIQEEDETPLYTRINNLEIFCMANNYPHIQLVKSNYTNTEKEVLTIFREIVKNKGEGIVAKYQDSPYLHKRSKSWIKLKQVNTCSLRIIDTIQGTGKYKKTLGALKVSSDDNEITLNVDSGFTDEDRKELWHVRANIVGKIIEIKYNKLQYDKKNNPYLLLPIFVEMRIDKDKADTIETIKREFDANKKNKE